MWLPVCLLCNLSASSTTWSLARNFRFSTIDWGRHKMLPMTHTSLFLSFIPFLHNIAAALFVWGLPFFNDVIKKFKYFVVYGEEASRGLQIWLFFRAILLQQLKKKKQCNDWERPEKLFLDSNKYATHEISTRARKKKFIKTSKRRKKKERKFSLIKSSLRNTFLMLHARTGRESFVWVHRIHRKDVGVGEKRLNNGDRLIKLLLIW